MTKSRSLIFTSIAFLSSSFPSKSYFTTEIQQPVTVYYTVKNKTTATLDV